MWELTVRRIHTSYRLCHMNLATNQRRSTEPCCSANRFVRFPRTLINLLKLLLERKQTQQHLSEEELNNIQFFHNIKLHRCWELWLEICSASLNKMCFILSARNPYAILSRNKTVAYHLFRVNVFLTRVICY